MLAHPVRKRLPMSRPSVTTSFQVGDAEGYITAGSYPDDGLGEIFLKTSKQGSTLAGVMDAFAIAVSLGLQYGVPLEAYVSKFINTKFEPSGMTNDPDIRFATSIVDYVFRRLALDHLPPEVRDGLGIRSIEERKAEVQEKVGELTAGAPEASPAEPAAPAPVAVSPSGSTWGRRPSAKASRRAALLLVRLEDAARRLVLRLRRAAAAPAAARRLTGSDRSDGPGFAPARSRPGGRHGGARGQARRPAPRPARDAAGRGGGSRPVLRCDPRAHAGRRSRPSWRPRGGVWFRDGDLEVHLGVEEPFTPAVEGASRVPRARPRDAPREDRAGRLPRDSTTCPLEGYHRCHVRDPFGNRLELVEPV